MKRSVGLVVPMLASVAAISVAGCGGGGTSSSGGGGTSSGGAQRYSSVQDVVTALVNGGFQCTQAYYSKSASGPESGGTCTYHGAPQVITVSRSAVTTKMVLADMLPTKPADQVWSDVGPNWWVESSKATAKLIQKAIGGRLVAGPTHS